MKKDAAEIAIRSLCHTWARSQGIIDPKKSHLSFYDFLAWLKDKHSYLLEFRSSASVEYVVEVWFDDEMGQNWRR